MHIDFRHIRAIYFYGLVLTVPCLAGTKTWDGGASTLNWADAANWNAVGVPNSSDAVQLDNSSVTPLPTINAKSGANCGTLTLDGTIRCNFLSYGGSTPYPLNLFGAAVNAANTGPLINASISVAANKINVRLNTNGELYVKTGKTFQLTNSNVSETGGARALTKTGEGTLTFGGSGPQMLFAGGFNVAAGKVLTSANALCMSLHDTVAFTNQWQ